MNIVPAETKEQKIVEVFKTNITNLNEAQCLLNILNAQLPGKRINIDLHDCDKILRVEGIGILQQQIMEIVKTTGIVCEPLR